MTRYSFERTALDIDLIHRFLSEESSWARNIPRQTVDDAIAHSLCLGAYAPSGQIGFARLITDHATFGYLCDVFVLAPYRGQGIARKMIETLLLHPDAARARRLFLVTSSAPDLYRKFGFSPFPAATHALQILREDAYGSTSDTNHSPR